MADARVPIVLVERKLAISTDSVASDQCGGLQRATEYLIALGHRRIALLSVSTRSQAGRERHRGFMEAMRGAGLPLDPAFQRPECATADDAYREAMAVLQLVDPPTAIIAGGNMLLAGVLRALKLQGKVVPRDLSVITVGDTDLALLAPPSFTAVRWDILALGREAALLMLENIAFKSLPGRQHRSVVIPTEIILRQSCGPAPR